MTPRVLIVSALDPSGGAGLLMDLRAVHGAGGEGVAAIAALTVQGPRGVRAVHPVEDKILAAQLETLVDELPIGAVKIGALGSAENVKALSAFLHAHPEIPVVLDPVIKPTLGVDLMPHDALVELRKSLLNVATIVTPNRFEAAALAEIDVTDLKTMKKAAKIILKKMEDDEREHWVLVKGGHFEGDPVDMLIGKNKSRTWRGARRPGEYRGTGCALSSAIAAGLAAGSSVPDSITKARKLLLKWMDKAAGRADPKCLRP